MRSLIVLLVLLCVAYGYGDVRLIRFNETDTRWMTEEEVEKLINAVPIVKFMDITDNIEPVQHELEQFYIPARPIHMTTVRPVVSQVNADTIYSQIGRLAAFTTRYYTSQTGLQAVNAWATQYRTYASGRSDITVNTYPHTWVQPSLVARIQGTRTPAQVVIIGGHIDSTSSGSTAPGADDDASGSACVLEAFRVIVASGFRPERSIEFHAYAAEEAGLRGSQAIANDYNSRNPRVNVVAMMQFDMTGFVRPGTTRTIGVVTDFTTAAVSTFIREAIREYITSQTGGISWTNTQCGYACSDHASWYRANYPAGFVFESTFANSSPYIHTPNDQLSTINRAHAADFAKLATAFAMEVSYTEADVTETDE